MALLDTLRGIVESDEQAHKRINSSLQTLFRGFVERSNRLHQTAAQAPVESMAMDLRKLADAHRETGELIRAALESRRSAAPTVIAAATRPSEENHWARIVEDLQAFHDGRDQVMDLGNDIVESCPELTDLFESLTVKMSDHIARLRREIARADPQAHN